MKPPFNTLIVADGIEFYQAAAALQKVHGYDFTISFLPSTSTKLNLSSLKPKSRVVLLGVTEVLISENDRDEWRTALKDFVDQITNAGHHLTGILDNWGSALWQEVLPEPSFRNLVIKPGIVEKDSKRDMADYFLEVTGATDNEAIRQIFLFGSNNSSSVGEWMFDALHSCPPGERTFRASYLIDHFARSIDPKVPDQKIQQWRKEALAQLAEYESVLSAGVNLQHGFWSICKDTKWTSPILSNFAAALHTNERAVVVHFNEATETGRKVSFSIQIDRANGLIELLEGRSLNITKETPYRFMTEMYARIFVQPEDERNAIQIIQGALAPE